MTSPHGPLPHCLLFVATSAVGDSPESGDQAMCYLSIPAQLTHDLRVEPCMMTKCLRLAWLVSYRPLATSSPVCVRLI